MFSPAQGSNSIRIETTRRAVSAGRFNPLFKKPGELPGVLFGAMGSASGGRPAVKDVGVLPRYLQIERGEQ